MNGRHLIVDFEASGLHMVSYPIEVGWCDPSGHGKSHLIRPAPGWSHWDPAAEATHGLSREYLESEGMPSADVAYLYMSATAGATVYADGGSFDQAWSDRLTDSAGLPSVKLSPIQDLYKLALEPLLSRLPMHLWQSIAVSVVGAAEAAVDADGLKAHRALQDAQRLAAVYRGICIMVAQDLK